MKPNAEEHICSYLCKDHFVIYGNSRNEIALQRRNTSIRGNIAAKSLLRIALVKRLSYITRNLCRIYESFQKIIEKTRNPTREDACKHVPCPMMSNITGNNNDNDDNDYLFYISSPVVSSSDSYKFIFFLDHQSMSYYQYV